MWICNVRSDEVVTIFNRVFDETSDIEVVEAPFEVACLSRRCLRLVADGGGPTFSTRQGHACLRTSALNMGGLRECHSDKHFPINNIHDVARRGNDGWTAKFEHPPN